MVRPHICVVAGLLVIAGPAFAAENGPGVTANEIRIGNALPYSGPASAYGVIGAVETAYFEMVNARGGVNGRKITLISLDDAYTPGKAVEQTRKLVESEQVLAIVGQVGTVTSSAVQKYLNDRKVPQILIASGASKWDDPGSFPYSTAMYAPYRLEGLTFARYLLANKPDAKLGLLSQNDDVGRDYVGGLKEGLGDRAAKMIVKEVTFDASSPTLDSQVVSLKSADADAVFLVATPKFGAQAIRKIAELNWKPLTYVSSTATSVETVLKPAGLNNSKDLISAFVFKQPDDPRWNDDADVSELRAFLQKWLPRVNVGDSGVSTGYITAFLATKILEACGDDLSRENIIKQATNLGDVKAPLLLPGITFTTTPESYRPIRKMQMGRFDGATWVLEGALISLEEPKR